MDELAGYSPAEVVMSARVLQQRIGELLAGLTIARKPRELLTDALQRMDVVASLLEEVDRDYVPLIIARDAPSLSACRAEWEALPVGEIRADDQSVKRLIDRSPTLTAMFRGGLDFLKFDHFGADDLRVTGEIFDIFTMSPVAWDDIRRLITERKSVWPFGKQDFQKVDQIGRQLHRAGIIRLVGFEICPRSTNQWEEIREPKKIPYFPDEVRLRLTFEPTGKPRVIGLASGDWLTALAQNIVSNHLERNGMDFEVYTKVGYQTARGLTRVGGDFDLLVRSQESILAIECKSGKLGAADFTACATKVEQLTNAFRATRTELPLTFWLVFNHHLTSPETVAEKLQQSPMTGVTIEQLRGEVMELFK